MDLSDLGALMEDAAASAQPSALMGLELKFQRVPANPVQVKVPTDSPMKSPSGTRS